jgi:ABC-type lipoprotein export system ATPase subunit
VLSFENVTKQFILDQENVITPVREVSLNVEQGEFIVITGRSGTGKTTLLNLAAGLVRPTSGRVSIEGICLSRMSDRRISALRSRKIGFIFQFPSLLPALNIRDNVMLPSIFTGEKAGEGLYLRVEQILDTLGLASKLEVYPRQLSAGEQKRVVIARALINKPQIIMADEPTSDLDRGTENEVLNILREINSQGVTFLVVTHNLEMVDYASRAFEMENGRLRPVTAGSGKACEIQL